MHSIAITASSLEALKALAACARVGNDDDDTHEFSPEAWDEVGELADQIEEAAEALDG